jgi:ureidoglycolate lyase
MKNHKDSDAPPVQKLQPIKATPESLAGYGYVIGEPDDSIRSKIDFYGDDVVVTQPARFRGNDDLCLNLVSFNQRPLQVRWMEYHTKHTQTFIPLSGKPFYMVLGKPTARRSDGSWDDDGTDLPDLASIQAFEFDGSAGLVMDVGVWHEVPFPTAGYTQFICICTNETNSDLETGDDQGECNGGDLTKKNIHSQFGSLIEIDVE